MKLLNSFILNIFMLSLRKVDYTCFSYSLWFGERFWIFLANSRTSTKFFNFPQNLLKMKSFMPYPSTLDSKFWKKPSNLHLTKPSRRTGCIFHLENHWCTVFFTNPTFKNPYDIETEKPCSVIYFPIPGLLIQINSIVAKLVISDP